jgi:hypothetical protein
MRRLVLLFVLLAVGSGCATAPRLKWAGEPRALLAIACEPGALTREAAGTALLKVQSSDASGQFPATVSVRAPDSLVLEITNLVGAPQALIRINGNRYSIVLGDEGGGKIRERTQSGSDSWGGIPLHWATDLFLGRIPCPTKTQQAEARIQVSGDELTVETRPTLEREAERYLYRFRSWSGKPWPEALHWDGPGRHAVDFRFEDPEDGTRSPRKWEARSAQGEVRARWRERKITPEAGK